MSPAPSVARPQRFSMAISWRVSTTRLVRYDTFTQISSSRCGFLLSVNCLQVAYRRIFSCWGFSIKSTDEQHSRSNLFHLVCNQTGSVINVKLFVDLEWTNGTRMRMVPSDRLQHIRPFRPGHYVVHGNWLGRVEEVGTGAASTCTC